MTETADRRLPGWRKPKGPAAREPLTLDRIIDAAIRIADDEGLEALSMRRLGTELGTGATTLYWHVRDKDELLDLMVDRIIAEVLADIEPSDGWRDELASTARAMRRVFLRHGHLGTVIGTRPTVGPNALRALEFVIGHLRAAGFADQQAMLAAQAVINWSSGFAVFEARDPLGPNATEAEREQFAGALAAQIAATPEDYPNTIALLPIMPSITPDILFESGLGWLLDGIEADLERSRRG